MKIQAICPSTGTPKNTYKSINFTNAFNKTAPNKFDSFEKSGMQVSFEGLRKNNDSKHAQKRENDLSKSLEDVSLGGMSFLLGLATSAAMIKMGEGAKKLLCDENGYLVSENGIKSDLINIDSSRGIIDFAGTGISIDASKCDVADWSNGIFRNYDGSIDIDLSQNKFIDLNNGILVDPKEHISAVMDNGFYKSIAVPSFGSGYPTCPWDPAWSTLQRRYTSEYETQKTALEKAGDFIKNLFNPQTAPTTQDTQDIFGNDIIIAKDNDGDTYLATYLKGIDENSVFAEFAKQFGKEDVAEALNQQRLKQYIDEKHPTFGTRVMVYEGGRNATGTGGIFRPWEVYDDDLAQTTLQNFANGEIPEPGSEEAKNFLRYQNLQLKLRVWKEPKISTTLLLGDNTDLDGDGIPEICDKNGRIIYSSDSKQTRISKLSYLFDLIDKNDDGKLSTDEISEFIQNMDSNGDGHIQFGEILRYFSDFFKK